MENEQEIVQLLKQNPDKAIRVIFEKYYEGLCLYAFSIVRKMEVAEEISEDLFVSIWTNAKNLILTSSLKAYLFRSIHNNSLKYLEKEKNRQKKREKYGLLQSDLDYLYPQNAYEPASRLIENEIEQRALKILEGLPEQCRKIYDLNRNENLNYTEISNKLSISVSTVKTQMSRAYKRFKEGLSEFLTITL